MPKDSGLDFDEAAFGEGSIDIGTPKPENTSRPVASAALASIPNIPSR